LKHVVSGRLSGLFPQEAGNRPVLGGPVDAGSKTFHFSPFLTGFLVRAA